jgi:hypothetical protein
VPCDTVDLSNLSWSHAGNDGSLALPYPAGMAPGDLLLLYIQVGRIFSPTTVGLPAGFTNIASLNNDGEPFRLCYRVVDGTEAPTVSVGANDYTRVGMLRVKPLDPLNPWHDGAIAQTNTIPSVDVVSDPSLVVVFGGASVASGSGTLDTTPDMCALFHRGGNFYTPGVDCHVECMPAGPTGDISTSFSGSTSGPRWGRVVVPTVSACEGDEGPLVGTII